MIEREEQDVLNWQDCLSRRIIQGRILRVGGTVGAKHLWMDVAKRNGLQDVTLAWPLLRTRLS